MVKGGGLVAEAFVRHHKTTGSVGQHYMFHDVGRDTYTGRHSKIDKATETIYFRTKY